MSDEKLKLLLKKCAELEAKAGITDKVEKAESGRFFPLGSDGDDFSPDEYFADEHDYFRAHIRNAYFSIQDSRLRMELIAARRLVESELEQSFEREANIARREEKSALLKEIINNWSKATVISIMAVIAGYALFQIPGAIAGAIAGYFIGNGVLEYRRFSESAAYINAKEILNNSLENLARNKLHPECFTHNEQLSGNRDKEFDAQSALANVRKTNE